jgi:hypothetical protein
VTELPHVERSVPDQIVAELLQLLESSPVYNPVSLDALRVVASAGRLTSEADVTKAIKAAGPAVGGSDAAA